MISKVNSLLEFSPLMDINKWNDNVDYLPPAKSIPPQSLRKPLLLDLKSLFELSHSMFEALSENFLF